jgi:hypothetical protein
LPSASQTNGNQNPSPIPLKCNANKPAVSELMIHSNHL